MNNFRRALGALCIVVAMVLGAFGGLSFAQSRLVSDSSATGTRGDDRHLVSAYDLAQNSLPSKEAEGLAADRRTWEGQAAPIARAAVSVISAAITCMAEDKTLMV